LKIKLELKKKLSHCRKANQKPKGEIKKIIRPLNNCLSVDRHKGQ